MIILFWVIEIALVLAVIIAITFYVKSLRQHKTPTAPGAVIDLCGISAVAIPVLYLAAKWSFSAKTTASYLIFGILGIIYLAVLGLDIRYCVNAYRTNKAANAKKGGKRR